MAAVPISPTVPAASSNSGKAPAGTLAAGAEDTGSSGGDGQARAAAPDPGTAPATAGGLNAGGPAQVAGPAPAAAGAGGEAKRSAFAVSIAKAMAPSRPAPAPGKPGATAIPTGSDSAAIADGAPSIAVGGAPQTAAPPTVKNNRSGKTVSDDAGRTAGTSTPLDALALAMMLEKTVGTRADEGSAIAGGGASKTTAPNPGIESPSSAAANPSAQAAQTPTDAALAAALMRLAPESNQLNSLLANDTPDRTHALAAATGAPADPSSTIMTDLLRGAMRDPGAAAAPIRVIDLPMSDRNWSQSVATQVHWLATNDVQSATLKISPEHLGPVEVHIDMHNSQVNVSFGATHPDTRAALEQAIPQLRSMLAGNGLTLGQASVQQEARSGSQGATPHHRGGASDPQGIEAVPHVLRQSLGLVDEYV